MHEVLVNRLGGLSLLRKSVVRLTDCPDMTLDVYRGGKTTIQQPFYIEKHFSTCLNECTGRAIALPLVLVLVLVLVLAAAVALAK